MENCQIKKKNIVFWLHICLRKWFWLIATSGKWNKWEPAQVLRLAPLSPLSTSHWETTLLREEFMLGLQSSHTNNLSSTDTKKFLCYGFTQCPYWDDHKYFAISSSSININSWMIFPLFCELWWVCESWIMKHWTAIGVTLAAHTIRWTKKANLLFGFLFNEI